MKLLNKAETVTRFSCGLPFTVLKMILQVTRNLRYCIAHGSVDHKDAEEPSRSRRFHLVRIVKRGQIWTEVTYVVLWSKCPTKDIWTVK